MPQQAAHLYITTVRHGSRIHESEVEHLFVSSLHYSRIFASSDLKVSKEFSAINTLE